MTATLVAAAVLGIVLTAPHVLRPDGAPPSIAAATWLSALVARAALTLVLVAAVVVTVPATAVFAAVSEWCWHVIPVLAGHLGFHGQSLADVAILLPAIVLVCSVASMTLGLWRAARRVAALMRSGFGTGPQGSVIVDDGTAVVAAAGLRHPRVVISAGALVLLDDAELGASLAHERGHIVRHHRWILLAGSISRALGRFVPGGRTALAELSFHLERDADRYAIDRDHQPRALASAICKVATGGPWAVVPATSLAGTGVLRRVSELLEEDMRARPGRLSRAIACAMVGIALLLTAAVPPAALAAFDSGGALAAADCPH